MVTSAMLPRFVVTLQRQGEESCGIEVNYYPHGDAWDDVHQAGNGVVRIFFNNL